MREQIKVICGYLFEIFIWYLYLQMGALSIALFYVLPRESITCIIGAIVFTFVPKIYKRYKKVKEE